MSGAAPRTDGVLRPHPDDAERIEAFLPAPAVQNHAANLAVLPGGDLGCVWFGGTQEGVSDISIWFSRLAPGGHTWSAPVRLSGDATRSEQNPVLAVTPEGQVWLYYTAQRAGHQDTAEVRLRVSTDAGATWSPPRTLFPATADGGIFVRQPPVVLPTGRWLLPVFHCVATPGRAWVGDHDTSAVMVSDDAGATWLRRDVPDSTGCVHMNIHPLADGTLLALFRSRWADHVMRSVSTDHGWTWTPPVATGLPNNNSSIQYVPLRDGRLALVYNHSSRADATGRRVSLYDEISDDGHTTVAAPVPGGEPEPGPAEGGRTAFWGAPRAPLSLALSSDGGHTWPRRRDLEVGDGHCLTNNSRDKLNRELSYPSIAQTPDGALHLAFTYFRQAIKYVRVRPEWVERG
ncbi:sialidase family protein [Goodfellowiella coeruleoviolacea]|uniref:Neuraminidase (Sialidase) n=1 Tax=Goodfellowiella coeruleoviolacea TaxID=334858 RepID=A0AAE3GHR5_9PSEU|nr:exo-alpha-sialidase [Goodfellowiella coeruleoviolacea]MCP2167625.1 putative neuraminidase (sialidase) [Goodfellowiella coeruleoviolacea]